MAEFSLSRAEYGDFEHTLGERMRVVEAWLGGTVVEASPGDSNDLKLEAFTSPIACAAQAVAAKAEAKALAVAPAAPEAEAEAEAEALAAAPASPQKLLEAGAHATPTSVEKAAPPGSPATPKKVSEQTAALAGSPAASSVEGSPTVGAGAPNLEFGNQHSRTYQDRLQKSLEELTFLPMESNALKCMAHLDCVIEALGTATNTDQIETATRVVNDGQSLLNQLLKGVTVSMGDLKRAVITDEKKVKKEQEDQQKKVAEQRKKQLQAEEADERRRLNSIKLSGPFKISMTDARQPAMRMFETAEAFKTEAVGVDQASLFSKPFLIKSCEAFKPIFATEIPEGDSPTIKLQKTLVRWMQSFPKSSALKNERVVAPVHGAMGADAAIEAFNAIVPARARSRLPIFTALAEHVMLFGDMKDSVHFGHEPNRMAALRAQHKGACTFLMMSAENVARYYQEVCQKEQITWEMYRNILKNITEADVKACQAKGITIVHGLVEPGMLMYSPAGWVLACRALAEPDSHQSALKFHFLPSAGLDYASTVFETLSRFQPSASDKKVLEVLQDVVTVAINTGPEKAKASLASA